MMLVFKMQSNGYYAYVLSLRSMKSTNFQNAGKIGKLMQPFICGIHLDNEMIIITDAHISKAKGNHAIFFKMLESLEKNNQDLIFLGDIFDLWVALPRY